MRRIVLAALAAFGTAVPAWADDAPNYITLSTRPEVEERFVLVEPPNPVASAIMFTGAAGLVEPKPGKLGVNFLIRTRDVYAARGIRLAIVDAPSDHHSGLWRFRNTDEHRTDIAALIAWLKQRQDVPVWLIGTSMGSISAAHVASRLPPGTVAGIVLTSSVTVSTRNDSDHTLRAPLENFTGKALIVANRDDACPASPPKAADTIAHKLTAASMVEVKLFSGGTTPKSDECEALSRHGYIGIEDEVAGFIADWITR
jgi:pimeloyl-ACP methyl ester carboxylesterase